MYIIRAWPDHGDPELHESFCGGAWGNGCLPRLPIMAQNGWTIPHATDPVQHAMRVNAFSVKFHDPRHVVNCLQRII